MTKFMDQYGSWGADESPLSALDFNLLNLHELPNKVAVVAVVAGGDEDS